MLLSFCYMADSRLSFGRVRGILKKTPKINFHDELRGIRNLGYKFEKIDSSGQAIERPSKNNTMLSKNFDRDVRSKPIQRVNITAVIDALIREHDLKHNLGSKKTFKNNGPKRTGRNTQHAELVKKMTELKKMD